MPIPDLIHLLKSPYWQALTLFEAVTGVLAYVAIQHSAYEPIGVLLGLVACFVFAYVSLGILFSAALRKNLLRPDATIEPRHTFFLGCSGAFAVLFGLMAIVYIIGVVLA